MNVNTMQQSATSNSSVVIGAKERCAKMEGELKCPVCSNFYCKPLLLPCSHNICSGCAHNLQESADKYLPEKDENSDQSDFPDIDKLSIVSETDSGVVCNNSRPNSYVSTPSIHNFSLSSTQLFQNCVFGIKCPVCKKVTYLGDSGFQSLPRNRVLDIILEKCDYRKENDEVQKCDLCENDLAKASVMCEQCEVFYCDTCRDNCHPARGPLAKHNLVDPEQGKVLVRLKRQEKEAKCFEHTEEVLSLYCSTCKLPICVTCHQDGPHINHDAQAIGAMSKSHKVRPTDCRNTDLPIYLFILPYTLAGILARLVHTSSRPPIF